MSCINALYSFSVVACVRLRANVVTASQSQKAIGNIGLARSTVGHSSQTRTLKHEPN